MTPRRVGVSALDVGDELQTWMVRGKDLTLKTFALARKSRNFRERFGPVLVESEVRNCSLRMSARLLTPFEVLASQFCRMDGSDQSKNLFVISVHCVLRRAVFEMRRFIDLFVVFIFVFTV